MEQYGLSPTDLKQVRAAAAACSGVGGYQNCPATAIEVGMGQHQNPADDEGVYALFVDLRKAFDSAPRETIWRILSSLGVPPGLVALVAELHKGMGACVKYHGTLKDRFSMRTGVRQGAVEGPTLWDLYFHFVVQDWRAHVESRLGRPGGVIFACKTDGDFNRRRMRIKTQASRHINVADVEYADDMMGLLLSFEELQIAAQLLADTVRDGSGELNVKKTKWMCIRSALAVKGLRTFMSTMRRWSKWMSSGTRAIWVSIVMSPPGFRAAEGFMGRWSSATFDEADDISCLCLHNVVLGCRALDAACTGVANDASCLVRMVTQHSWPHVAAMFGAAHLTYRAAEAYGRRGCGDLCCAGICHCKFSLVLLQIAGPPW